MDTNMEGKGGMCESKSCGCPHHKMLPIVALVLGIVFLGQAMGWMTAGAVSVTWPILLIVWALSKMFGHMCKCCHHNCDGKMCDKCSK